MKNISTIIIIWIFLIGCLDDNGTNSTTTAHEITFVLCEGAFQGNDGNLWQIKEDIISQVPGNPTGDNAQSMDIYNNKLLVINNSTGNIVEYTISPDGLVVPTGNVLDLNGSQPREIEILHDKAYITQWLSDSIVVIGLEGSLSIQSYIEVSGSTEGITTDGASLYASIKYSEIDLDSYTYTPDNKVIKIDPITNTVTHTYTVIAGPDQLIISNNILYVSSYYVENSTYKEYSGMSSINLINDMVSTKNYEEVGLYTIPKVGTDLSVYQNLIYRVYKGGIAAIDNDLNIDESSYIGTSNTDLYSMEILNDHIYLGFGDHTSPDQVIILDFKGKEISNFEVGASPGSFALWQAD